MELTISQPAKVKKVSHERTQTKFGSQRALVQYFAVLSRPEVCVPTKVIPSGNNKSTTHYYKYLIKGNNYLNRTSEDGRKFVRLGTNYIKINLATDV